jgi:dipeptidyl aminopeptidase/acylaminoacyl peptidase
VTADFLGAGGGGLIAQDVARGGRPSWSPDGTKVAYAAKADGKWDICVSAPDGSGPVDLTNDAASNDRNPRWSPDGSKIAFESDRTGNWDVFSMAAGGSAQTGLTNDPADDRLGDWSPDSSRIVFSSWRSGGGDLYTMAASGGAETIETGIKAGHTYSVPLPARAFQGAPRHFRFCVQGTDSSLNQSAQSCARVTLVTAKKKKKR